MSLVIKGFPQTSIPPLISTIPGIIDLPRVRRKVLNRPKKNTKRYFSESPFENLKLSCEILIVEIQPVLLEKMRLIIRKSHYKSHFGQFQAKKLRKQGTFSGICLSSKFIHN